MTGGINTAVNSKAAVNDFKASQSMPASENFQTDLSKESLQSLNIQCKLSIGAVDDSLEQEADTMADTIMRMPSSLSFGEGRCEVIQRKCTQCKEEEKLHRKPLVSFIQRKESSSGAVVSDAITSQINSSRGSGCNMDKPTQSFMESRFGTGFSNVKIHTDNESVQMNRELNARAFTVGNDIYFNEGQYNPISGEGKHLLAHELTHTVQQRESFISTKKIQKKGPSDVVAEAETVVTYKPGKKNPVKSGKIRFEYRAEKELPAAQLQVRNHPLMVWAVQHVFNITEEQAIDIVAEDNLIWGSVSGRTKPYLSGDLVSFTLPTQTIGKWIGLLADKGIVDPNVAELFEQLMELQQELSDRDYSYFIEWVKMQGLVTTDLMNFQNLTPEALAKLKMLLTQFNEDKYSYINGLKGYFLTEDITRDMRFEEMKDRFFNKKYEDLTQAEKDQILVLFKDKALSTAFIALEESKIISKQETEKYKQHPEQLTELVQLIAGYGPGFLKTIEKQLIEFGKFNETYYKIIQVAPSTLSQPMANSDYSDLSNYYYTYQQSNNDVSRIFAIYSNRNTEILSLFSGDNVAKLLGNVLLVTLSTYAWSDAVHLRMLYLPEQIDNPIFKKFREKFPATRRDWDTTELREGCTEIIINLYPDLNPVNNTDAAALAEMRLLALNRHHRFLSDVSVDFRSLALKSESGIRDSILETLDEKPGKVDKTQGRLIGDRDLIWEFDPLLYYILSQEHIDSSHAIYKVVAAKIKAVDDHSFWVSLGLGALGLVLGVLGIFTGGISTAVGATLLAGSTVVGIIDLAMQYSDYNIQSDAHGAGFTVPFAEDPSSLGLWISLVFVVLDVKGLAEIFSQTGKVASKLAKGGADAASVAGHSLKKLASAKNIDEYANEMYEVLKSRKLLKEGITKEAFIKGLKGGWQDSHELIANWKQYEAIIEKMPAALKATVESSGLLKLPVEIRSSIFKIHEFDPQAFEKLMNVMVNNPEHLRMIGLQIFGKRTLAEVYGQLSQVLKKTDYEKAMRFYASVGHEATDTLPELLHLMNKGNLFSNSDLAIEVLTNRRLQQLTLGLTDNANEMLKLWETFAKTPKATGDDFLKFIERNSPYGEMTKLEESGAGIAKLKGPETNKGVLTDINGHPPSPKSLEGLVEDMQKLEKAVESPATNISKVTDDAFKEAYDAEVKVGEHTFRRNRTTGKWCRFSVEVCNLETPEKINSIVEETLGSPPGKLAADSAEEITTKIDPAEVPTGKPEPGKPGSDEHRAQRWKEYEDRTPVDKRWKKSHWDNVYTSNMEKAKKANEAVKAYHQQIGGWGRREVTVDVEGEVRRLDIADDTIGVLKGVEYKTGEIYASQDILWEVARDEILVNDMGWKISWVFRDYASKPLIDALKKAKIEVIVKGVKM